MKNYIFYFFFEFVALFFIYIAANHDFLFIALASFFVGALAHIAAHSELMTISKA